MDIGKYALLLKAVEMQNLTKAATALGYTQSGASHIIRSIEHELGVTLLRRDQSGTHLTSEGQLLLPTIREMVVCGDKLKALTQSVLGLHVGIMRIAAFTSMSLLLLPKIIGRFHAQYPNIQIEIVSGNGSYAEIVDFLLTAKVDCVFVRMPVASSMNCIPLFYDPLLLVLPPGHPLAEQEEPITFAQLEKEPFLVPPEGKNYDTDLLFKEHHFEPKVAFTMEDALPLLAMAENGLGCTILSSLLATAYSHKAVLKRLEANPMRLIGIATRANQTPSPLTTAFVELVCQMARELPSEENHLIPAQGSELCFTSGCADKQ